jgi:DNA-binding HxlR family transcriptional regulator
MAPDISAATLLPADRSDWNMDRCSMAKTLSVVGTRSALLIMREAFYGTRRFDDFARLVAVTEAVAAARLKELVDAGLLERTPYQEPGQRTRHEYVLTPRGRDLLPVVLAMVQFGDRHLAGDQGPPVTVEHTACGSPVAVEVRCAAGHTVGQDDLTVRLKA